MLVRFPFTQCYLSKDVFVYKVRSTRFVPSPFYTRFRSPHFIPSPCFIPSLQSVVGSPQSMFHTD